MLILFRMAAPANPFVEYAYSIRRKTARTLLIKDYANSLTNMSTHINTIIK